MRFENIKNIKNRYLVAIVLFLCFVFRFFNCRLFIRCFLTGIRDLFLFFILLFLLFYCCLTRPVRSTFTANSFLNLFFHWRAVPIHRKCEKTICRFWLLLHYQPLIKGRKHKIFRVLEMSLWFNSSQSWFIIAVRRRWFYITFWENICTIRIKWFTAYFVKTLYNLKRISEFLNVF